MNLLKETLKEMKEFGKTKEDIAFYGVKDVHEFDIEDFDELLDIEDPSGYFMSKLPFDVVIVFKDNTYMERVEDENCEWWEYHEAPKPTGKIVGKAEIKALLKILDQKRAELKELQEQKIADKEREIYKIESYMRTCIVKKTE